MKILLASTPLTGHINPLLAVGHVLMAGGHELVVLSGSRLQDRIERAGAQFQALPGRADADLHDIAKFAPELTEIPPGYEWLRVAIERLFIDHVPAQHMGLQQALQEFPADFRYFLGLQEMVPVGMADAYAQITGRPALVNLHTAPGMGNAQGQLYNAFVNKTPLIVTAGNQRRTMQNQYCLLTNIEPTTVPRPRCSVRANTEP